MAATIKIKNSSTASAVPTSSDLVQGELAVNVTDKRIFTENASGTVVELGTNPTILTLPDGSASAPTLTNDGDTNTGVFFPAADTVGISTGGTERARVDSSGNLGLGVTPSAWNSDVKAFQFGQTGAVRGNSSTNFVELANNQWLNSAGSRRYIQTAAAVRFELQTDGSFRWQQAASGTAGNAISFTQAMTLDASGNLGVGSTSPASYSSLGYRLVVGDGSGNEGITIATGTGDNGSLLFADGTSGSAAYIGYIQYDHSVDAMKFGAGGTERARIDSSGNLLVGTTSVSTWGGKVSVQQDSSTGFYPMSINNSAPANGNGYVVIDFYRSATRTGYISNTNTATAYNTSSDYRLKENIQPMSGALAKVTALKPVTYKWKIDGSDGEGFIAHELQSVIPHAVTGEKDAVNEDGSINPQGIDTSFLVATLTAAIQELKAIVDAQAVEIAALKG